MEPLFLYQTWLTGALEAFVTSLAPLTLKGKPIMLSPRQYAAALMQAYFGKNSLAWIAEVMGLPVEILKQWRQEPGFLLVMDWSKAQFAEFFQETMLLTDFSPNRCITIAGEFSLLEDTLRVRIRMQLYEIFRLLGEKLSSRHRHGLDLEAYDLTVFRRLFLFFLCLEHFWPSAARKVLRERLMALAREVVWPASEQQPWPEELINDLERVSFSDLNAALAARLTETLAELRLLH